jgi:hypothetical protein
MRQFSKLAVAPLLALLAGCAVSPMLVDRNTGRHYAGRSTGTLQTRSGEIETRIDGEKFSGVWAYIPEGFVGTSESGKGSVTMNGDRGSILRCFFVYKSTFSGKGIGDCAHTDGRSFELKIRLY